MQRSVVGLPAFVVTGTVVRAVTVLGGMPGVVWVVPVAVFWILGPALFLAVSAVLVVGVGLGDGGDGDLIFVLFISTHLVSTRPAPICRSKTLFSILEFNMVSSSIWCSAPNKVVEQELTLPLVWFGGHPPSPGFV